MEGGIVGGDEGPIGGVAQVIGHGVKVGVGVHGEEGQEEDGEGAGRGKRRSRRESRTTTHGWNEDGVANAERS